MEDNNMISCRGTNLSFQSNDIVQLCELFKATDPDNGFVAYSFISQIKKENAYKEINYDDFLDLTESMDYFVRRHVHGNFYFERKEYNKLKRSGMTYCKAFKKFFGLRMIMYKYFYDIGFSKL